MEPVVKEGVRSVIGPGVGEGLRPEVGLRVGAIGVGPGIGSELSPVVRPVMGPGRHANLC